MGDEVCCRSIRRNVITPLDRSLHCESDQVLHVGSNGLLLEEFDFSTVLLEINGHRAPFSLPFW